MIPKLLLLVVLVVIGAIWNDGATLTAISVLAGVILTLIADDLQVSESRMFWASLQCATRYRKTLVRVSVSYLISIPVDETYLLVRGRRLTQQFQPVGGVYKTTLSQGELVHRFNANPDVRFTPDSHTKDDLRLRIPGERIPRFLAWFFSESDREIMPFREFYEELVSTSILDAHTFRVVDFRRLGYRHLPLHIDPHSGAPQLIVANVYQIQPTPAQDAALSQLRQQWESENFEYYFATPHEIEFHGALGAGGVRSFDISPTARWLLAEIKSS